MILGPFLFYLLKGDGNLIMLFYFTCSLHMFKSDVLENFSVLLKDRPSEVLMDEAACVDREVI